MSTKIGAIELVNLLKTRSCEGTQRDADSSVPTMLIRDRTSGVGVECIGVLNNIEAFHSFVVTCGRKPEGLDGIYLDTIS